MRELISRRLHLSDPSEPRKSRLLFSVLIIGAALALVGGATFAVFTDSQFASGTVNAGTIILYLNEPADDDDGDNEAIFELTENILPGETRTATVRLNNTGTRAWDLSTIVTTNPITSPDCDGGGADFSVGYVSPAYPDGDDHGVIHVEPSAYQDVNVNVTLAGTATDPCQGYIYSFVATFNVTQHGP